MTERPVRAKPDYPLLAFVTALVVIGLQLVYSSTFALAIEEYDNVLYFLLRQAIWASIGAVAMLLLTRMDYRWLKPLSPVFLGLASMALVISLLPQFSVEQYGASRWLRLGPLPPVQPSEFLKLAVVISLAAWLSSPARHPSRFRQGLLPPLVFLGLLTLAIMRQPDLGTALVILATACTMLFLAGIDLKSLVILLMGGGAAGYVIMSQAAYRADRLASFVDPWRDPTGVGFHIIQLLIALGSGGVFGLGIGASRQKFFYVPGAHTDGIFAILGEETGFIGCLLVMLLYAGLVYRGARIVQQTKEPFGQLLGAGIVSWLAYQTLINIGGITHSIPLTGIPLPFLSYGGSSLAAGLAAVGILLSISRRQESEAPERPHDRARGRRATAETGSFAHAYAPVHHGPPGGAA